MARLFTICVSGEGWGYLKKNYQPTIVMMMVSTSELLPIR